MSKLQKDKRIWNLLTEFATELAKDLYYNPESPELAEYKNQDEILTCKIDDCALEKIFQSGNVKRPVKVCVGEDDSAEWGQILVEIHICEETLLGTETDIGAMVFYDHFHKCFPISKEFAPITLSLLHEMGHFYTELEADAVEHETAKLDLMLDLFTNPIITCREYCSLPAEQLATNWGGHWLLSPQNRATAHAFEQKLSEILS